MSHRKVRKLPVAGLDHLFEVATLHRPAHIAVFDHLRFWRPRGAGGVDESGQVLRPHLTPRLVEGIRSASCLDAAGFHEVVPAHDFTGRVPLDQHNVAQMWKVLADGQEPGQEARVFDEDDSGLAMVDDVGDLLGGESRIQAHRRAAGMHDRQVGDRVLGSIPHEDGAEAAPPKPECLQTDAQVTYLFAVLSPGEGAPALRPAPPERLQIAVASRGLGKSAAEGLPLDGAIDFRSFLRDVPAHGSPSSPHGWCRRPLALTALPMRAVEGPVKERKMTFDGTRQARVTLDVIFDPPHPGARADRRLSSTPTESYAHAGRCLNGGKDGDSGPGRPGGGHSGVVG